MNSVERWLGESILCPLNIANDDSDDKKIKAMTSTMTKQIHINEHTKSNGKWWHQWWQSKHSGTYSTVRTATAGKAPGANTGLSTSCQCHHQQLELPQHIIMLTSWHHWNCHRNLFVKDTQNSVYIICPSSGQPPHLSDVCLGHILPNVVFDINNNQSKGSSIDLGR